MPAKRHIELTCEYCEAIYYLPPSKAKCSRYCCAPCRDAGAALGRRGEGNPRFSSTKVSCAKCGKELSRPQYRIEQNVNHFCDHVCKASFQKGQTIPSAWRQVEMRCEYCGETYSKPQSQAVDSRFCSAPCRDIAIGLTQRGENNPTYNRTEVTCAQCGTIFLRIQSHAQRDQNHFCDQDCKAKWQEQHQCGENNPAWAGGDIDSYGPNWKSQRREARKRDAYRCQVCDISEKKMRRELEVHHIIKFRIFGIERYLEANHLSNLITLCPRCHRAAEAGKISFQPSLL